MDDRSTDRTTGYCEDERAEAPGPASAGPPYADCVRCGEPTEYPASRPGVTLCPVCEWQEAQRTACSG
ncbi:hypothetical protein ABZS86_06705 [Streptomyces sp. NPDC005355]|uniref:hypothetical protein n=1 Tax=Streptomyces sp. NPDC005355 TaxID=3157038 RepID=UPI0033BF7A03